MTISPSRIAFRDLGAGPPVLALHGAYSAGAEIAGFLAPMLPGNRLLIPDLPGHGDSRADGVASVGAVVDRLEEHLEATIGTEPVAVVGHSFGAHVARGLAARRPGQVRGLALICPLVPRDQHPEPAVVVADDGAAAGLEPDLAAAFVGYVVVRTATTLARFRDAVVPALGPHDEAAIGEIMKHGELDLTDAGADRPTLILTARHDAWVGYRQHVGLLAAYPRATSIVVADAGHALPHERPELVGVALRDWLARC